MLSRVKPLRRAVAASISLEVDALLLQRPADGRQFVAADLNVFLAEVERRHAADRVHGLFPDLVPDDGRPRRIGHRIRRPKRQLDLRGVGVGNDGVRDAGADDLAFAPEGVGFGVRPRDVIGVDLKRGCPAVGNRVEGSGGGFVVPADGCRGTAGK